MYGVFLNRNSTGFKNWVVTHFLFNPLKNRVNHEKRNNAFSNEIFFKVSSLFLIIKKKKVISK
jgi:hypothetical protein